MPAMVEVFKTNIRHYYQSQSLIKKLLEYFPGIMVNFDLEDCDKILRVEGNGICPVKIVELITADGYECETLV
jgi:hypothetical protein